jgi:hypothetical protein
MFRPSDFSRAALLALWVAAAPLPALAQKNDTKAARFYEDALVRYEKKDLPGAIIQLKNALQIDKNMLPVHASCDMRALDRYRQSRKPKDAAATV